MSIGRILMDIDRVRRAEKLGLPVESKPLPILGMSKLTWGNHYGVELSEMFRNWRGRSADTVEWEDFVENMYDYNTAREETP